MKLWLVLLALWVCHPQAWAALKWQQLRADLTPVANEKSVEAVFPFVNEGPAAVTIKSLKSSCGCTTARLEKKIYAPGEKGEVRARFDIGRRRGPQVKTVAVHIAGEADPVILTLAVVITTRVKASPELVLWKTGETNTTKDITLSADPSQPIRALKVTSTNPRVQVAVETVKEGQKYLLHVTPQSTGSAAFAVLNIEAESAGALKTLRAYAQVKPAAR